MFIPLAKGTWVNLRPPSTSQQDKAEALEPTHQVSDPPITSNSANSPDQVDLDVVGDLGEHQAHPTTPSTERVAHPAPSSTAARVQVKSIEALLQVGHYSVGVNLPKCSNSGRPLKLVGIVLDPPTTTDSSRGTKLFGKSILLKLYTSEPTFVVHKAIL